LYIEKCALCGEEGIHKIAEDTLENRHPWTAYVCSEHFKAIFGPYALSFWACTCPEVGSSPEISFCPIHGRGPTESIT
jgi:hypothetical protein